MDAAGPSSEYLGSHDHLSSLQPQCWLTQSHSHKARGFLMGGQAASEVWLTEPVPIKHSITHARPTKVPLQPFESREP
jgi:hypothetical protein